MQIQAYSSPEPILTCMHTYRFRWNQMRRQLLYTLNTCTKSISSSSRKKLHNICIASTTHMHTRLSPRTHTRTLTHSLYIHTHSRTHTQLERQCKFDFPPPIHPGIGISLYFFPSFHYSLHIKLRDFFPRRPINMCICQWSLYAYAHR